MPPKKTKAPSPAPKHHGPTPMPLGQWMFFWFLALGIIIVTYASFAACTFPTKGDLTYRGELPASSTIENPVPTTPPPSIASGARTVFDPSNRASNGSELTDLSSLNHDAPNVTATYTNKAYKIAVDIPYNFDWGKPSYALEPYEVSGDNTISYGTLEMLEGAIGRSQSLTIGKKTTVQQVRDQIKNRAMTGKPNESTVRGIPVISYQASEIPCRIVIGVGKSATYTFQDCRDGIKELEPEAILATIRAQ